jgi:hypothetical protein
LQRRPHGTTSATGRNGVILLSPPKMSLYWTRAKDSIAPAISFANRGKSTYSGAARSPAFASTPHFEIDSREPFMADEELSRNEVVSYQRILTAQQDRMLRNQDRVDANQVRLDKMLEKMLTNQAVIIANQQRIKDNQTKLDKIVVNQGIIVSNQQNIISNQQNILANEEKLDRLLTNQAATIVANQENILSNQEKLDRLLANQSTIISNLEDRVIPNQEKIVGNQNLISDGQQKILAKELVDRLAEADRGMASLERRE